MANLTSTTITGTLNTNSTITGPGSGVSGLNAANVSSGTLSSDRLPTVPTSKGGTGLTSIGTAGQVLSVNPGASGLQFVDASGGVSGSTTQNFNAPGNYTATSGTQMASITVAGGGGGGGGGGRAGGFTPGNNGGTGGNSSFGSLITATGGSGGQSAPHGMSGNTPQPGGVGGFGSTNVGALISAGLQGDNGITFQPSMGSAPAPGGAGGTGLANGGNGGNGDNNSNNPEGTAGGSGGGGSGGAYGVLPPNQLSGTIAITVGSGGAGGNKAPQFGGAQNGQAGQSGFIKVVDFT